MHKATSIVLAALLIILPVEQVLAQAAQQEGVGVDRAAPPGAAASLFRVPPLTENAALLLGASSDRALLNPPFADALFVQEDPDDGLNDWELLGIALGVIAVIGAAVGGTVAWGENNNPNSFKSKHNVFYGIGYGALFAIPIVVIFGGLIWACGQTGADCTNL